MAQPQLLFQRTEKKYRLSAAQYEALLRGLEGKLRPDEFFESTVCSVYYDDESYSLIRHSLSRPVYKEKLRLRSYKVPGPEDEVFVELKKKYKGVVYKRRVATTAERAEAWLSGGSAPEDGLTAREIDFFLSSHTLRPAAFIGCERRAYLAADGSGLRLTFDENLRWRAQELSLCAGSHGEALLSPGEVLLELKIPQAVPLYLARLLSENGIFPLSFSKVGACYREHLLPERFAPLHELVME